MLMVVMDTRIRGYDKYRVTPDLIGGPFPLSCHPRLDRGSMLMVVMDTRMRGYDKYRVTPDLIGSPFPPDLSPPT